MIQTIEVIVSPTGESRIETKGFAGAACQEASRFLESALGAKTSDPIAMYLNDIYSIAANLAGLPGISIPCGFVNDGGNPLPVGLQLVGPHFGESRLLSVSHQYQLRTEWHRRVPPGYG